MADDRTIHEKFDELEEVFSDQLKAYREKKEKEAEASRKRSANAPVASEPALSDDELKEFRAYQAAQKGLVSDESNEGVSNEA